MHGFACPPNRSQRCPPSASPGAAPGCRRRAARGGGPLAAARGPGPPGAGPSPHSPAGSARRSPAERHQSLRRGEGRGSWAPPRCPPRRPPSPAARARSYLGRRPRRPPRAGLPASRGILRGGGGGGASPRHGAAPRQPRAERSAASAPRAARSPDPRRRRAEPAAGTGRARREAGRGRRGVWRGMHVRREPPSSPSPPSLLPSLLPRQPCPAQPLLEILRMQRRVPARDRPRGPAPRTGTLLASGTCPGCPKDPPLPSGPAISRPWGLAAPPSPAPPHGLPRPSGGLGDAARTARPCPHPTAPGALGPQPRAPALPPPTPVLCLPVASRVTGAVPRGTGLTLPPWAPARSRRTPTPGSACV